MRSRHSQNCSSLEFCDIAIVDVDLPSRVVDACMALALDKNQGRRSTIPFWKAGRTIPVKDEVVLSWYSSLVPRVSSIIGTDVTTTPGDLPTTCAILVYEEKGDFINWHYDVNYFDGRFFTMIVPITFDETCTTFVYTNKDSIAEPVVLNIGSAVLFEGERVFHKATKLCKGQKRVIISLQFTTDAKMSSSSNRLLHTIKDATAFT